MEIRKIYEPIDARPLESGAVQKLYRFANNYGASVVKGEHTYGGEEGLWELAVVKFKTDGDFNLDYTTPAHAGCVPKRLTRTSAERHAT